MPPILIDTNLLVYLYDTGSTGKAAQAWRVLDKLELTRMWLIFDLTSLIVLEAARGARDHGLPYYDAQIWAAARLNQVTVVFSEDFSDGQVLEGVRFVNPFSADFRLQDWA